jgi:hypothetical protein
MRPARPPLQGRGSGGVLRNQEAHRQHVGFEKAVALEEILGAQLRPIREERDAKEFFLLREIDGVLK